MDQNLETVRKILELVGGQSNILSAENCMTRLRFRLRNMENADERALNALKDVLNVVVTEDSFQVVVGPGKAKKFMDLIRDQMGESTADGSKQQTDGSDAPPVGDWQKNKQQLKGKQKKGRVKSALQAIANIFVPLIPAIIAAGLFNGVAGLLNNLQSSGAISPDNTAASGVSLVLSLMGGAFMSYFAIYVGVNSAKVFGATPALGGMIGAMTIMSSINDLAQMMGLYDADNPLSSVLQTGRGGILAVIFGVFLLAQIEKFIRRHTPDVLDLILTPTLSVIASTVALVFVIMPVTGWISDGLMYVLNFLIGSSNPVVSVVTGYLLAALFLPLVLVGMHQALIPIYAIQLEQMGAITLFPVLAMAGAGQVGTCIAIYLKARKQNNHRLTRTIAGALPAGVLGIGEPLLYGVTLPMGKPFITGGLGAGFGGAYVMLMHVTSISWGTSGVPGILLMTPNTMLHYFIGLLIGVAGGFVLGAIFVKASDVAKV